MRYKRQNSLCQWPPVATHCCVLTAQLDMISRVSARPELQILITVTRNYSRETRKILHLFQLPGHYFYWASNGANGKIFVLNIMLHFQQLLYHTDFIWSKCPEIRRASEGEVKINIGWGKAKCHIKGWSLYFVLEFKFDIVILC